MANYSKEAKKALSRGDFLKAGDLYMMAGMNRLAISAYIQGSHYLEAARLLEKEEDWRASARYYAQAGKLDKAAELYLRAKDYVMASSAFEKVGDFSRAADMATQANDLARAAMLADQARQLEKAANLYVKVQNFQRAAEIYSELLERALEERQHAFLESHVAAIRRYGNATGTLYARLGDYIKSARCFMEAENHAKAAESYEQAGDLEQAADLYFRVGDYGRAGEVYERAGKLQKASEMAERSGDRQKASELAEKSGQIAKAAQLHAQMGNNEKAADLYFQQIMQMVDQRSETRFLDSQTNALRKYAASAGTLFLKLGNYAKAGWCYEQGESLNKAAECYIQARNFKKAGEILYRLRNYQRAYEMMIQAEPSPENSSLVADICFQLGKYQEAGDLFVLTKQNDRAAEAYEKSGNLYKAAVIYKEAGDLLKAAEIYTGLGEHKNAAALFLEAGQFREAATRFETAGMTEEAIDCFLQSGDSFSAGKLLAGIGNTQGAIPLLQKVGMDNSSYKECCLLLGQLLVSSGLESVGVQKLLEGLGDQPVSKENLEVFYSLGVGYENLKQWDKAQSVYDRICAKEINFKDVLERLQKVKAEASRPPAAPRQEAPVQAGGQAPVPVPPANVPANGGTGMEPDSMLGKRIREYQVLDVLGRGGMGVVYRCRHVYLNRERAIKVIESRLSESRFAERFIQEAKILSDLHNRHLVQLYEFGTLDDGRFFMVLELIIGESVKQRIQRLGTIPAAEAIPIIREAAVGLDCAHQKGIIHRDIAPDNLMMVKDEAGREITKVIDFGIAKSLYQETQAFTQTTMFIGKPEYASPEQCGFLKQGEVIDPRSDIYSLAVTFYHMLCGKTPFFSPTPQGYLVKHVTQEPKPIGEYMNPGTISPQLEKLIMKSLNKHRELRPESMRAFIQELDQIIPAALIRLFDPSSRKAD
jgi:tetratricopeptide (TPR) repeat protein